MKTREKIERTGAWDVLVVDADPGVAELVKKGAGGMAQRVRVATSVDQAEAEMLKNPADVMMVNLQISDNGGTKLIESLRRRYPRTEAIAMSRVKKSEVCLDAWRAGAADMILAPIHAQDVQRSLSGLCERRAQLSRLTERNDRLRHVCKQLNKARHDISKQVDLLCNDLVRAYQDLAQQLNQTQLTADYGRLVDDELDIESLLRKTMEWVLKKLGPVNAAVYLPDADKHFALGAYLNLDTEADAGLIEAITTTVVQQAQGSPTGVALDDDRMIDEMFGEEGELLKGRAWLAMGCPARREFLAVLVIFRKQVRQEGQQTGAAGSESGGSVGTGVDAIMRGVVEAITPVLGEKIGQALAFYHRMHPRPDESDDEYGEAQA